MVAASDWCCDGVVFLAFHVVSSLRYVENRVIDRVSSLITGTLARRGLALHALGSLALHRANVWLHERFPAASAQAIRITDHVLVIECSHSIVLQELQAQSVDLKHYLASECPFAALENIQLLRAGAEPVNPLAPGKAPA